MSLPIEIPDFDKLELEPTPQEIENFKLILQKIRDTKPRLNKLIRAGIDVNQSLVQMQDLETRIMKILQEFG